MATIGFLHTAQVHVATFDALVRAADQPDDALHAVVPDLLGRARREGASDSLADAVATAMADLVARGADAVVCTCSTLGPLAERADLPVAVVRIDRPMAAAAVLVGGRIGVVAALESTLAPTRLLLAEEANRAGVEVTVVETCVPEAWAAFEAGDTTAYLRQVAEAARTLVEVGPGAPAGSVDVVVLAQASMAGAAEQLGELPVPVFASPRLAVQSAAVAVSRGAGG